MTSHTQPPLDKTVVDVWIFDLDNTLYPASCNLFAQISHRMGEFLAEYLNVSLAEARIVQKQYFRTYGTTLRGMMTVHDMDPAPFLDYVHRIDFSPIPANPALASALQALPGRKIIFTNGTHDHARRVTDRLGVTHLFDAVFDIGDSGYMPKPHRQPYDKLVDQLAIDPARAILFEDIARNLAPAAALGMKTVWVRNEEAWAAEGQDHPSVHYHTDDLVGWLDQLTGPAPS